MTTTRTPMSSQVPADISGLDLEAGAALLVGEIERYLAARARASEWATAHPLVTKTTQQLVDEALSGDTGPAAPPALTAPPRLLRLLPERVLKTARIATANRPVSVTEHLELTALVIESYGWAHGVLRTRSGSRCIAGAQTVLRHLGYGEDRVVHEAGQHLDKLLQERGERGPYWQWNDAPGRHRDQVLELIRTAAATARKDRR